MFLENYISKKLYNQMQINGIKLGIKVQHQAADSLKIT